MPVSAYKTFPASSSSSLRLRDHAAPHCVVGTSGGCAGHAGSLSSSVSVPASSLVNSSHLTSKLKVGNTLRHASMKARMFVSVPTV
eukprot:CAMPEP_0179012774 /NCGR_PEP_ID=MMETSP0796-20121207/1378_1 /TAXON_ID=73915 /ORGANISM="Pyrodinium bahamense, Strain pbaha01" /LENGTH=85 /DNA_ID=CAMNT_0020708245 /DNA_START=1024 /DNA_END=1281 /DNA_ORIENTATION=+